MPTKVLRSPEGGSHHLPFVLWPEPSGPVLTTHLLTHEDGTAWLKLLLHPAHVVKDSVLSSDWPGQGSQLARLEILEHSTLPLPCFRHTQMFTLHKSHTSPPPQKGRRQTLCWTRNSGYTVTLEMWQKVGLTSVIQLAFQIQNT